MTSEGKRNRSRAFSSTSSDDSFSFVSKRLNTLPSISDSDSDTSDNTVHIPDRMDSDMRRDMKAMFGEFKNDILLSLKNMEKNRVTGNQIRRVG